MQSVIISTQLSSVSGISHGTFLEKNFSLQMLTSALGTMIGIDLLFCVTDRLSSFSTTIVFSRAQSDFTLLWPREEALLSFFLRMSLVHQIYWCTRNMNIKDPLYVKEKKKQLIGFKFLSKELHFVTVVKIILMKTCHHNPYGCATKKNKSCLFKT